MASIDATDAHVRELFERSQRMISARGGLLEASPAQRRACALYEDGVMVVDRMAQRDANVLALRETAARRGVRVHTVYLVDLAVVRLLYENAERGTSSGVGHARRDVEPMEAAVAQLIKEAASAHASDIHIKIHSHEAELFFRSDGQMMRVRQIEARHAHALLATLFNGSDDADATYRVYDYQAARISATSRIPLPPNVQSIRLQFNPLAGGGRHLVARLLYAEKQWGHRVTLQQLGFLPVHVEQLAHLRQLPEGANFVSGPTGSGKSTTLKVILEQLYRERHKRINMLSIEDPPEYEIAGAAQLPVTNVESEEQRAAAYRKAIVAALRSDPDVIMPGEARDASIIALVFTAAMTGHQVWTSLHANSAMAIIDRLRDQSVDTFKLTDPRLLTGLIAQRLVRLVCPHCSVPIIRLSGAQARAQLGDALHEHLPVLAGGLHEQIRVHSPAGCDACRGGYAGRRVVAEVICPDQTFLDLAVRGQRNEAESYWRDALGGVSIAEHGWVQLVNGHVDPADLLSRLGPISAPVAERQRDFAQLGLIAIRDDL
ncbi:GspE/PulE family protein [Chitinasiproducens palmae]|nr:ATPase, T2SS/T4P/T4SS family [Chitinasiproducens palmae]